MGEIIYLYNDNADPEEFMGSLSLCFVSHRIHEYDPLPINWDRDSFLRGELPSWMDSEDLIKIGTQSEFLEKCRDGILRKLDEEGCLETHVFKPVYLCRDKLSLDPPNGRGGNFYPPVDDCHFLAGFFWVSKASLGSESCFEVFFAEWRDYVNGEGIIYRFTDPDIQMEEIGYDGWQSCQSLAVLKEEFGKEHTIREARKVISWE